MSEEIHETASEPQAQLATVPAEPSQAEGGGPRKRPRRRRGGQGRNRSRTASSSTAEGEQELSARTEVAELPAPEPESDARPEPEAPDEKGEKRSESTGTRRPRRRRSRGGKGNGARPTAAARVVEPGAEPVETTEEAAGETAQADQTTGTTPRRRRRRRGRRGGSRPTGDLEERVGEELDVAASPDALAPAATETEEEEPQKPAQVRRMRSRPTVGRRRRERPPQVRRVTDKGMLITEVGERDQIAVLEGRTLVEHYITRSGAHSMVGNVYLGKVQNVLPGMEAAFVDVGRGRNAVLYAGEVAYDEDIEGEAPRIEEVLKPGHNVLVQVTKDPMGGKGARLTQEVSLPGRFLVLVPNSEVFGISRRLPERERARLKDILKKVRPSEHGVIVRTAAEDASAEDIRADLDRLIRGWEQIEKSAKRGKAPRLLYEEPELTIRVVRDVFTGGEFKELITDSPEVHDRVVGYLRDVAPELVDRVHKHDGRLPLLEAHHVDEQIHKALERKVWLPSGGYIVIDRSEAMTVIDVNTGKHVGTANLEETVTKTNTEAAVEIARQLRLRDIGGIIIIDFIDMLFERNRDKVIQALKDALAQDKTRTQVFDITPLGLLEMTRKRVSAGLVESFSETCPTCEGRGIVLTYKM
jgi:ribonuclease E